MKLIFVYNANSGKLSAAFDIAHKLISPSTYQCNLCQLTHGAFKERDVWKKFKEESDAEMVFYHKDEFEHAYDRKFEYPVVLKEEDGELVEYISAKQINSLKDVENLIARLKSK